MFWQLLCSLVTADISIDGDTNVAFTESTEQRFLAYGWQVIKVEDGDKYVPVKFIRQ